MRGDQGLGSEPDPASRLGERRCSAAAGVDTEAVRDAMEGEKAGQTVSARLPPTTPLKVDETAHLLVNPSQLHLFDLETGLALR